MSGRKERTPRKPSELIQLEHWLAYGPARQHLQSYNIESVPDELKIHFVRRVIIDGRPGYSQKTRDLFELLGEEQTKMALKNVRMVLEASSMYRSLRN